jgi:hypothetical protein
MAIVQKFRFTRTVFGSLHDRMICKVSFGYTETLHNVATASPTAIMAAQSMSAAIQTLIPASLGGSVTINQPDVPRVLTITPGGTAADSGSGLVLITGLNVEGKTIGQSFQLVPSSTAIITGTLAFKSITSIVFPASSGTDTTISVGFGNALGTYHRLFPNHTAVKEVDVTGTAEGTIRTERTLNATAPTITSSNEKLIELNTITPVVTPDGAHAYELYYIYQNWSLWDKNDNPIYSTSTSTSSTSSSSSSSTSSTSTSSTSTSSTSTSSTSSSTSSTSTSTTTTP